MNFKEINEMIHYEMSLVKETILEKLNSKIILIEKIISYIMNSGGKRIRPIITILAAKSLNYNGNKHIIIAALVECIHAATLLHDDVIDKSYIRRGKNTANVEFGDSASLLVGDFIYTKVFQMMISLNSISILKLMSKVFNIIIEGEMLQLENCNNPNFGIKNYMKVLYSKTACLFEASLHASAILSKTDELKRKALLNYGKNLGIAFQLHDDLLDYTSNIKEIGKNVRNDLKNGKITMPLIHALNYSNKEQSKLIENAIRSGNSQDFFELLIDVIHEHKSIEYTKNCIRKKVDKAIYFLNYLPKSSYKDALIDLAMLITNYNN